MNLSHLLLSLSHADRIGSAEGDIAAIRTDSRKVQASDLFIAIRGSASDGHAYIADAIMRGARCIVAETPPTEAYDTTCTWVTVPDARKAVWQLAGAFYDHPADTLSIIGVTGTNGKTTVTHLVHAIFKEAGMPAACIGTLGCLCAATEIPLMHTTPDAVLLQELLQAIHRRGLTYVVMEVSSHAIDQERIGGIEFSQRVLTNITGDHLDYHGSIDDYAATKLRFFNDAAGSTLITNNDDAIAAEVFSSYTGVILRYSIEGAGDITATDIIDDSSGLRACITTPKGTWQLHSPLIGRFNLSNVLAAIAVSITAGIDPEPIQKAIASFKGVPGRLERVSNDLRVDILIDYAHTADGLEQVLTTLKPYTTGRLHVVFGCGGDRDRTKRPLMGAIATRYADHTIITTDNARHEEPLRIIEDILDGCCPGADYVVCPDRREAITTALSAAADGDIVVIAGKGHESVQIIGDEPVPFNDRSVVEEILHATKGKNEKAKR